MKRFEKNFLISIFYFLILQAVVFFFIKYFQGNAHYINSFVDDRIPFIPQFIYIYNIFYPFMFVVLYITYKQDKDTFYSSIAAGIIGYLICDVIFLIYPTLIIRPDINVINIDYLTRFIVGITYYFDNPALNCFPSVHCLFCFQALYMITLAKGINRNMKILFNIIAILIAISTLLVKQHYFYDFFGSLVVFGMANIITNVFKLDDIYKRILRCRT